MGFVRDTPAGPAVWYIRRPEGRAMRICIPRTSQRGIRHRAVLAIVLAVLVARGAAASTEPSSATLSSIAAVRQLTVADLDRGQKAVVRGTVTYATANVVYLQHGDRGVRAGLAAGTGGERPAVGDVVEVAGFVDMSRLIGGLFFAVCRRVGGGEPPEPVRLDEPQLLAPHGHFRATQWPTSMGLYDGRLIRCRAVVAAPLRPHRHELLSHGVLGTALGAGGRHRRLLVEVRQHPLDVRPAASAAALRHG